MSPPEPVDTGNSLAGEDRTYAGSTTGGTIHDGIEDTFYPGQNVQGYIYVERLPKAGGFGLVHKVFDENKHRYYAMKVLHPKFRENLEVRKRFKDEAKRLVSLDVHANLVQPIQYCEEGDVQFLFTEFIDGYTLDAVGQRSAQAVRGVETTPGSPRPQDLVNTTSLTEILISIANGMDNAWRVGGLVHLDLKPANIVYNRETGSLKIIDFGLSQTRAALAASEGESDPLKCVGNSHETEAAWISGRSLSFGGGVAGTLPYMAPEQFRGLGPDRYLCPRRIDV